MSLSLLLPALLATALATSPDPTPRAGVVVRLQTDGSLGQPSAVRLVASGAGVETTIDLADGGEPPDVAADDGTWSGGTFIDGEDFQVFLLAGDQELPVGSASFPAEQLERDLNLVVEDGAVSVRDGQLPGSVSPTPSAPSPSPGAPTTGAVAGPPPLGPGAAPGGTDLGLSVLGGLLGLVSLATLAWWWRQPVDATPVPTLDDLDLLAEPGLLGPGTPSPSEGVAVWGVTRSEAAELVGPLLATLARDRAVVVALPGEVPVPDVLGGPVFRVDHASPAALGPALDRLRRGGAGRVAGFVLAEQLGLDQLAALAAAVPRGAGITVLAIDPPPGTRGLVWCRRQGAHWLVGEGDRAVLCTAGLRGLEPVSSS